MGIDALATAVAFAKGVWQVSKIVNYFFDLTMHTMQLTSRHVDLEGTSMFFPQSLRQD